MFNLNNVYRWCDAYGGGIVIAKSIDEAEMKLYKKYDDDRKKLMIWQWTNDDYFDEEHPDVLDIYDR